MTVPQPFQYQGGRRALAPLVLPYLPISTTRLVEPFCGSAAGSRSAAVLGGGFKHRPGACFCNWRRGQNSRRDAAATRRRGRLRHELPMNKMQFTQMLGSSRTSVNLCATGIFIGLLLLCSCATEPAFHRSLPADMPISPDAGRGGDLFVTVQLENGQELPMIMDTGAGSTVLDDSLKRKLGKPLGTTAMYSCFGISTNNLYTAPKLYLGGAPLTWNLWTGKNLLTEERDPIINLAPCARG